ncbi:hypothetical protein BZA77DRAFT_310295 [Pyronema omphalodes]|nr:hypothetical protein BZA77DRAFT_310295 [Pyronema omphalodes]
MASSSYRSSVIGYDTTKGFGRLRKKFCFDKYFIMYYFLLTISPFSFLLCFFVLSFLLLFSVDISPFFLIQYFLTFLLFLLSD